MFLIIKSISIVILVLVLMSNLKALALAGNKTYEKHELFLK